MSDVSGRFQQIAQVIVPVVPWAIIVALFAVAGVVLWKIVSVLLKIPEPGLELTLPLVVIAGVVILLLVLAVVSLLFAYFQLGDPKQALGLPEGSVRAVIALSLVVLFAIVSIFLYESLSMRQRLHVFSAVTAAKLAEIKKTVPAELIVPVEVADDKFDVIIRNIPNPASEDLAKQLLVLLGTLVTSVAGFYFGANSVASAQAAVTSALAGKPTGLSSATVGSIKPQPLKGDGSAQKIAISGANLGQVNDVTLRRDNDTIHATEVKAEDTLITCVVTVDAARAPGKWDLMASDGKEIKKFPQAIEIANASTLRSSSGAFEMALSAVAPPVVKANGLQKISISGSNLGKVNDVMFRKGSDTISATDIKAEDAKVTCNVVIDSKRAPGKWDVIVSDGTHLKMLREALEITV
jgi:sporulation protein YlmC with PRC-barrel domain